jgi:hypothetical protein
MRLCETAMTVKKKLRRPSFINSPPVGAFKPEEDPRSNKEVPMTKAPAFRSWAWIIPCSIFIIPFFRLFPR